MNYLKDRLDNLCLETNVKERIAADPIEFPHRYKCVADIEIAGFIASSLAYGKVGLFKSVLNRLFGVMGESPADFCSDFQVNRDIKRLEGIKYRFNSEQDIAALLYVIGKILRTYGSLEYLFYSFYKKDAEDIREGLIGFVDYVFLLDPSPVYGCSKRSFKGLKYFFPSPRDGSSCKRLNLFLRWMVRRDKIDLGIWDKVSPSKLIVPLDTHMARITSRIGLTTKKTMNWNMAKEITDKLRILDPADPVRYDFALCHHGISGKCPTKNNPELCRNCVLNDVCQYSRKEVRG